MDRVLVFSLSLALICGAAFGADQKPLTPQEQAKQFRVSAEFSEAENTVEELTGTQVADPESQARLLKARGVFESALAQFPELTLALNFLARTYAFPGQDTAMGIATFEKSLAIEPNQPDAIARLVDLYLKAGQRAKAGEAQARLVKRDANPQLADKVDTLIARWDGREAQRLIGAGRTEEGFALLDKAMHETNDPDAQRSLREARNAASRDWEISLYNSALEKAKAADYRGSWAILEKLLAVAKEPEVVERAKRLREKIKPAVVPSTGD